MVRSVHKVVRYTKICFNIWKITVFSYLLVPEVQDIAIFTVVHPTYAKQTAYLAISLYRCCYCKMCMLQQGVLIRQLQEQHYHQYMQQLHQQQCCQLKQALSSTEVTMDETAHLLSNGGTDALDRDVESEEDGTQGSYKSLPYAYHLKTWDVQDLCVVACCISARVEQNFSAHTLYIF
jgi:hypothetical protein